jgi:hypothetical protein
LTIWGILRNNKPELWGVEAEVMGVWIIAKTPRKAGLVDCANDFNAVGGPLEKWFARWRGKWHWCRCGGIEECGLDKRRVLSMSCQRKGRGLEHEDGQSRWMASWEEEWRFSAVSGTTPSFSIYSNGHIRKG